MSSLRKLLVFAKTSAFYENQRAMSMQKRRIFVMAGWAALLGAAFRRAGSGRVSRLRRSGEAGIIGLKGLKGLNLTPRTPRAPRGVRARRSLREVSAPPRISQRRKETAS